jgi:hypothetical protein
MAARLSQYSIRWLVVPAPALHFRGMANAPFTATLNTESIRQLADVITITLKEPQSHRN